MANGITAYTPIPVPTEISTAIPDTGTPTSIVAPVQVPSGITPAPTASTQIPFPPEILTIFPDWFQQFAAIALVEVLGSATASVVVELLLSQDIVVIPSSTVTSQSMQATALAIAEATGSATLVQQVMERLSIVVSTIVVPSSTMGMYGNAPVDVVSTSRATQQMQVSAAGVVETVPSSQAPFPVQNAGIRSLDVVADPSSSGTSQRFSLSGAAEVETSASATAGQTMTTGTVGSDVAVSPGAYRGFYGQSAVSLEATGRYQLGAFGARGECEVITEPVANMRHIESRTFSVSNFQVVDSDNLGEILSFYVDGSGNITSTVTITFNHSWGSSVLQWISAQREIALYKNGVLIANKTNSFTTGGWSSTLATPNFDVVPGDFIQVMGRGKTGYAGPRTVTITNGVMYLGYTR